MATAQRAAHNGQKAPIHAPQPAPDAAQLERDDANDKRKPWEKVTQPWTKVPLPWKLSSTASISGGAGDGIKEMLRKNFYVVRKKNHVVRKIFYVASISVGVAGRKNRPRWSKTSRRCGHFCLRRTNFLPRHPCVYRIPIFFYK